MAPKYHIELVREKPGKDTYGNPVQELSWKCVKTGKLWSELDYGNRRNILVRTCCRGCKEIVFADEIQQPWPDQDKIKQAAEEGRREYALEEKIYKGFCPDCLSEGLLAGPEGGGSQNVMCANPQCGSKFNVGIGVERISDPSPLKPKLPTPTT